MDDTMNVPPPGSSPTPTVLKILCFYNDRVYHPVVPPAADTDDLARLGDRLMFRHSRCSLEIFWASRSEVTAGWVIGVST